MCLYNVLRGTNLPDLLIYLDSGALLELLLSVLGGWDKYEGMGLRNPDWK